MRRNIEGPGASPKSDELLGDEARKWKQDLRKSRKVVQTKIYLSLWKENHQPIKSLKDLIEMGVKYLYFQFLFQLLKHMQDFLKLFFVEIYSLNNIVLVAGI